MEDDLVDEVWVSNAGGGCGLGGWPGAGIGKELGKHLKHVHDAAGASDVEIVGGDAGDDLRGDGEGGGAVLDDGELERLGGVEIAHFSGTGFGASGGVVVIAEELVAESWRAALASRGVDVTAADACLGDGFDDGCF
jgi:hypothetical protein